MAECGCTYKITIKKTPVGGYGRVDVSHGLHKSHTRTKAEILLEKSISGSSIMNSEVYGSSGSSIMNSEVYGSSGGSVINLEFDGSSGSSVMNSQSDGNSGSSVMNSEFDGNSGCSVINSDLDDVVHVMPGCSKVIGGKFQIRKGDRDDVARVIINEYNSSASAYIKYLNSIGSEEIATADQYKGKRILAN